MFVSYDKKKTKKEVNENDLAEKKEDFVLSGTLCAFVKKVRLLCFAMFIYFDLCIRIRVINYNQLNKKVKSKSFSIKTLLT